jgi:hypothetical protein
MESPSQPSVPSKEPDYVAMNYRYSSAWNEVNARIAQRQNAINIYVTLSTAIIAVLFTSTGRVPTTPEDLRVDPRIFSLLIPVVSLVFGFLNFKHDRTIAILRSFLADCESIGPKSGLLTYNISTRFKPHADKTRKYHDFACMVLIFSFNAIGLLVTHEAFPTVFGWSGYPVFVYILVGLFSMWLIHIGPRSQTRTRDAI